MRQRCIVLTAATLLGPAAAVPAGRDGWRQLMRHVVLQFWLSLDGYSCDEDTELYRLMEEIRALPPHGRNRGSRAGGIPRRPAAPGGNPHHGTGHLRRDGQVLAQLRPPDRGTLERDPQGRVLRQPPVRDLAPGPDRPRGHGGGTGAAEAGTWRGDHRPRRNQVRAVPDPARPGGRVPALGTARRGGTGRAAVHRAGPAGDPEPGQDHGVSVRHPRAVLRADRPRGVTFKIPNRAAPPAHETGLERDAVPGLAPTG